MTPSLSIKSLQDMELDELPKIKRRINPFEIVWVLTAEIARVLCVFFLPPVVRFCGRALFPPSERTKMNPIRNEKTEPDL